MKSPLQQLAATKLIVSLILSLVSQPLSAQAADAAGTASNAAAQNAAGSAEQSLKSDQKRQEGEEQMAQGNTGKGMELLAQAAMLAASAAAMAAAAGGNKKREKVARSADPIQTPAIAPNAPRPSPEAPSMPTMPMSSPIANISPEASPEPIVEPSPSPQPQKMADAALSVNPLLKKEIYEEPESTIPDNVPDPRTKLGYDERNVTSSSNTSRNLSSLAPSRSPSESSATSTLPGAGAPNTPQEKWVKNQTTPENENQASSGHDTESSQPNKGEDAGSNGITDMLNSLMGKNGAAGMEGGFAMVGMDLVMENYGKNRPQPTERKENIFEHASWRYQKLTEADRIQKRAGLSPLPKPHYQTSSLSSPSLR